jgi:hypothetical protein
MRFVLKAERAAWHAKAMDAAKRADLGSLIQLWLETSEIERLIERLRTATGRGDRGTQLPLDRAGRQAPREVAP